LNVIDIRGITVDALVGPEHGASRIFVWCVTGERGGQPELLLEKAEEQLDLPALAIEPDQLGGSEIEATRPARTSLTHACSQAWHTLCHLGRR